MRSNLFANLENTFEFADREEIVALGQNSLGELVEAMSNFGNDVIFKAALLGAKLGVAGDGVLNDQEKELLDRVFGRIWKGPMDQIYRAVSDPVEESDYDLVRMMTQLGNAVAMPFLKFVLSFAYIDEVFEDEVAGRLDGLFGMNLLVEFFSGDQEEVPAPRVKLRGLDAEIVQWLREDDRLVSLQEILTRFSGYPKTEVKAALDRLCEQGILYGGEKLMGNLYGLA